MRLNDHGILIQKRTFSENKLLLSFFTENHGRINGISRFSRRNPIDLGYYCRITWSAKLDHQLGFIEYETQKSSPFALLNDYTKLLALQSATSLLAQLLSDHHPYSYLYKIFHYLVDSLQESPAPEAFYDPFQQHPSDTPPSTTAPASLLPPPWHHSYVLFEKILLEQLGFGLSLEQCVVTGQKTDLLYISPKSGCAVSKEAGKSYHDKLFSFPKLFYDNSASDMHASLHVLGYFLQKHLLNGILPRPRMMFCDIFEKSLFSKSA